MRKVIIENGKSSLYDTATAKPVGEWEAGGRGPRDWHWCHEVLYRTKAGKYFVHGEGGGLSPYMKPSPDGMKGPGERIVPYTLEAAKKWASEHMDGDAWEREFGAVGDEEASVAVKVPPAVRRAMEREREETGRDFRSIAASALRARYGMGEEGVTT